MWTVELPRPAEAIPARAAHEAETCSAHSGNLREIYLKILTHSLCSRAASPEDPTTRVLEWPDQIQATGTRHHELRQVRCRAVRALLVARHGDAVQIPAHEAGGGSLHVERTVAVPADDVVGR